MEQAILRIVLVCLRHQVWKVFVRMRPLFNGLLDGLWLLDRKDGFSPVAAETTTKALTVPTLRGVF